MARSEELGPRQSLMVELFMWEGATAPSETDVEAALIDGLARRGFMDVAQVIVANREQPDYGEES